MIGQSWNGYGYVGNSPLSSADPTGLYRAGPRCNVGGVMCLDDGDAGGGFTNETQTSVYVSAGVLLHPVYSAHWDPFGGYRRGDGGPGGFLGRYPVLSPVGHVAVPWLHLGRRTTRLTADGGPQVADGPILTGISVTTGVGPDGGHRYLIRGMICRQSAPTCDADWRRRVFEHVDRNDIPFNARDDRDRGEHLVLGRFPIWHDPFVDEFRTVNEALEGHPLRGKVTHEVRFEGGRLVYDVTGEGPPGESAFRARFNNLLGEAVFRRGVSEAVYMFSRPPTVRELPAPPAYPMRRRY